MFVQSHCCECDAVGGSRQAGENQAKRTPIKVSTFRFIELISRSFFLFLDYGLRFGVGILGFGTLAIYFLMDRLGCSAGARSGIATGSSSATLASVVAL
ncbi:hypothetical protein [Candidatus Poriferisodalis sp.]|uniref:hypothetical protein n=1 Tax=Candidatus Poriferisodalis sp. TaxID=3101277 RepID=UPI003B52519E